MTTCPTSTNPLTAKGFYGSIGTMVCYACPGQCSNCNIDYVIANYPLMQPIVCGGDNYCTKGIVCTSCLQGSSLVGGTCVDQTTCRLYAYYKKGNSSSTWSPTNCYCLDGFYFSSYISCSACDLSCLTCSGPNSNQCLTCPEGYSLSSGSCGQSQIYQRDYWYFSGTSVASSGRMSSNYNTYSYCGSYYSLFGFQTNYNTAHYFYYSTPNLYYPNFYAISFRMQVLFIDNWETSAALYFRLGSASANPSFIYNYNNYASIGEQQCGTSAYDYLIAIGGKIDFAPTGLNSAYTIYVNANMNPVQNASGFYYQWGVVNSIFSVLRCHADCYTCTGPAANQCTSCWDGAKVVKNGSCVCDSANNYFYVVGSTTTCTTGCPACYSTSGASSTSCYYRDYLTSTCVNPPTVNCSAPNVYGYPFEISNSYGSCVQNCSSGYYAVPSLMKCTADCTQFSLYYYSGGSALGATMRSCLSACPSGTIANPYTSWCVSRCPTSYYYKLENRNSTPECTNNCPTGYESDLLNECVKDCPAGYFKQTISGHNKCVQVCTGFFYGENVTGFCVDFCPPPSIADITTHLCVN